MVIILITDNTRFSNSNLVYNIPASKRLIAKTSYVPKCPSHWLAFLRESENAESDPVRQKIDIFAF